jgi:hypothetical protein
LNNIYTQEVGEYKYIGYFNHPTLPRIMNLDKVLYKTNDSVFYTNVGDLDDTYGRIVLNIHKTILSRMKAHLCPMRILIIPYYQPKIP